LAPTEEYRDALGLGERTRRISVPSHFPASHVKYLYDPTLSTRFEEIRSDPRMVPRISDRISALLQSLPVNTAVFFPSFDLMEKVYHAGLELTIPPTSVIESPRVSTADLWRSIDAHKQGRSGGVILGVSGGRIAEGLDFPGEELEAVVIVGIPYPRPTARREALRRFLDARTGRGWEYTMEIPARRAMQQAIGRMIRSEHDRGIAIILDHRAPAFAEIFPGLEPIGDLAATARAFYGRRARWSGPPPTAAPPQPLRGDTSLPPP
jgi:DNA excision repair protein ERCC-2